MKAGEVTTEYLLLRLKLYELRENGGSHSVEAAAIRRRMKRLRGYLNEDGSVHGRGLDITAQLDSAAAAEHAKLRIQRGRFRH